MMIDGDLETASLSCGPVAGLIHDIPTVKELIDRIVVDADQLIRVRLTGFLDAEATSAAEVAKIMCQSVGRAAPPCATCRSISS